MIQPDRSGIYSTSPSMESPSSKLKDFDNKLKTGLIVVGLATISVGLATANPVVIAVGVGVALPALFFQITKCTNVSSS